MRFIGVRVATYTKPPTRASTIKAPPAMRTLLRLERMGAASGRVESGVGAGEGFGIGAGVVARVPVPNDDPAAFWLLVGIVIVFEVLVVAIAKWRRWI